MFNRLIDAEVPTLKEIRDTMKNTAFNSIRKVLPNHAIDQACETAGHMGRACLLSPVVVVLHMIVAALWPEDSFTAAWQLMWASLRSRLPAMDRREPASGTRANARARLPMAAWNHLFDWLSGQVQALSESVAAWRGHRVVLLDGTTVSMPDTTKLHEAFGATFSKGKRGKFPLARLVTAALANTMTVIGYSLGRYDQSEIALSWSLLKCLRPGDLLVADRHFAAAHYYVRYVRAGFEFITRMNAGIKLKNLTNWCRLGSNDFLVRIRVSPKARRADRSLPKWTEVRIIQTAVRIRGKRKTLWLVTSLLDAKIYPAIEIIELYRRRWRIETLLKQFKVNLSADVLRSRTPEGVRKEVAARLIAINIVRTIMLEAALEAGIEPLRISFVSTVRILVAFAPRLATAPAWQLLDIYRAMLEEIGSHQVPWRPDRIEPRMIKREIKHYPSLKTTRTEWRLQNVA